MHNIHKNKRIVKITVGSASWVSPSGAYIPAILDTVSFDKKYETIDDLVYHGYLTEYQSQFGPDSVFFPSPYYDAIKKWSISNKSNTDLVLTLVAAELIAKDGELVVGNIVHKSRQVINREYSKESFDSELAEIVSCLPEKLQKFVTEQSWDQGHSSGYREVLNIARSMVQKLSD